MATYLITWNPESWAWDDYDHALAQVRRGKSIHMNWTCQTKKVESGDRIFLLRQGNEGRGIVGAGTAVSEPEYDKFGKLRVQVELDELIPVAERLDRSVLARGKLAQGEPQWRTRFSGRRLPDDIAEALEAAWRSHLSRNGRNVASNPSSKPVKRGPADSLDEEISAFEGVERKRFILHRTRERALRERKLREARQKGGGRIVCEVPRCGFDFERMYGTLGDNFAHVHHLDPLGSETGPRDSLTSELAVVCANCHAMIHRGGQSRALDALIPVGRGATPKGL